MAERVLLDPAGEPDAPALAAVLSESAGLWERLSRRLDEMGAVGSWSWGGRKYGWERRYKRAGRPFLTLTPLSGGCFSALVVLGRAETEVASGLPLSSRGRGLFDATPQLHDGRWLFVPVESEADVDDVVLLVLAKLPERVRQRLSAAATTVAR